MTIKINQDKEHVKKIREALEANFGFCPCQLEKNEDTKCMCKNFLNQKESGWCHCKLYYKEI